MKVRFLADADLDHHIVMGVARRRAEIDFLRLPLPDGLPDRDVLRMAAELDRVLVSHDTATMRLHLADFLRERSSPGLLLIPQRTPIGVAIERLIEFWEETEAVQLQNQAWFLPRTK